MLSLAKHSDFGESKEDATKPIAYKSYLFYNSLQYLRMPSPELIKFSKKKLSGPQLRGENRDLLVMALAAWGTKESVAILESYGGYPFYRALIINRDKLECTRLLVKRLKSATTIEEAVHKLIALFFAESVPHFSEKFFPKFKIHPIKPKGKEADEFIKLFKDYLQDSGNITLTNEERKNFQKLIKEIEEHKRKEEQQKAKVGPEGASGHEHEQDKTAPEENQGNG